MSAQVRNLTGRKSPNEKCNVEREELRYLRFEHDRTGGDCFFQYSLQVR